MRPRYGDWVQTLTGHRFYVLDPEPGDIHIEDISGSLGKICRFNGHPRIPYFVGQHCVLGSYVVEEQTHNLLFALAFLLHDSGESYLGDMTRPLKNMPELEAYRLAEKKLNRTIEKRFSLPEGIFEEKIIKEVDNRMLFTEKRDLLVSLQWGHSIPPYDFKIKPWSWRKAERKYLERYHELCLRLDGYPSIVTNALQVTQLLPLIGRAFSTREQ
jgi:5'-deoxynucleotidase YfbR-like HD superfamily hydrolase